MSIEHNVIADPNIHEPKNIATANDGEIYIANGSSGGAWKGMHHLTVYSDVTQTVSGSTTWTDIALEVEGHKDGIIHSISVNNEQMTVAQTGHYMLHYSVAADSSSGTSIVEVRLVADGTEIPGSPNGGTLGAADQKSLSRSVIVTLTLNQVIKLQFYSSTANGRLIYPGSGATSQPTAILSMHQLVE